VPKIGAMSISCSFTSGVAERNADRVETMPVTRRRGGSIRQQGLPKKLVKKRGARENDLQLDYTSNRRGYKNRLILPVTAARQ